MSANSLPTNRKQVIDAVYPERGFISYEKNTGKQFVSQTAQANLVQWSNQATAIGTVAPGEELVYTTSLDPIEQYSDQANLAINYLTIHSGTAITTNSQVYPSTGTINGTEFKIIEGYDYLRVNNPYNSAYTLNLLNVGTGTYTLYFYNRWQYIQNNSGASS